jgi:hypothetical protein
LAQELKKGNAKQAEKDAKKRADVMRVILIDELDALMTKK